MVPSLGAARTSRLCALRRVPRRPLWQASRLERGGGATRTRPHRLAQPLRLPTRDATSPEQQRPPVWPSSAPVPTSFVLPAALPRRPRRLAANASCLPAVFGDLVLFLVGVSGFGHNSSSFADHVRLNRATCSDPKYELSSESPL